MAGIRQWGLAETRVVISTDKGGVPESTWKCGLEKKPDEGGGWSWG